MGTLARNLTLLTKSTDAERLTQLLSGWKGLSFSMTLCSLVRIDSATAGQPSDSLARFEVTVPDGDIEALLKSVRPLLAPTDQSTGILVDEGQSAIEANSSDDSRQLPREVLLANYLLTI